MRNSSETVRVGVSVVMPVHNGGRFLDEVVRAICRETEGRPCEVIAIDDHSTDDSRARLDALAEAWPVRVYPAEHRGMSAALNQGIRLARHALICQVDQDVVVEPGWLEALLAVMDDPGVGAAQGVYVAPPRASRWSRVMGLDLRMRYDEMPRAESDHVCTGNVVYRARALREAGLFDTRLGYGNDNDLSYRLRGLGYRLLVVREARAVHHWRDDALGYLRQQYGFGYGRLDVVAKHPRRWAGDAVSGPAMMAHAPLMAAALAAGAAALLALGLGLPARGLALLALALVGLLVAERVWAAWRAWRAYGDGSAWWFPAVHLLRDVAWVAAVGMWTLRRVLGQSAVPHHSMMSRTAVIEPEGAAPPDPRHTRILGIIPAYNEAANLPAVIAELRRERPDITLLVVDDGSSDGTWRVAASHGVAWLSWPMRRGVGAAIRAGLVYASRLGFGVAVRVDADGQHSGTDIDALLAPIWEGRAEVVMGSRYTSDDAPRRRIVGILQRALARCLTLLTGRRVTDPTSGFCAFGPRAVTVLAQHHPDGYPEPELRLFLSRNGMAVLEVPVADRERLQGRTSLTVVRVLWAAAHVALALLVVPLRPMVGRPRD